MDSSRRAGKGVPLMGFTASLAIAGLALLIVGGDDEPDEPVFIWDLYEESLTDPNVRIKYADHPEYFIKSATTDHAMAPGAGFPSEQVSWLRMAGSARDLLDHLGDWFLSH